MKRTKVFWVVSLLIGGAWLVGPLSAGAGEVSISLGTGFRVGGAHFRVAYSSAGYFPYYLRVSTPLYYPGFDCTAVCHVGAGHFYHAPYCPVVRHHFVRFGYVEPYPWRSGWHGYGPNRHHRHPAWHRGHGHHRHHGVRGHGRHHSRRSRAGYLSPTRGGGRRADVDSHRSRSHYRSRFKGRSAPERPAAGAARRTRPPAR